MVKKFVLWLIATIGVAGLLTQLAFAHVLISDSTNSIGAVLHVTPDDDPVAGQSSSLYFDLQGRKANASGTTATITSDADGREFDVPVKIESGYVRVDYTFSTRGVYDIKLVVQSDKSYTFNYSQRVSRGTLGLAIDEPSYPLANIGFIGALTGFVVLGIIVSSRNDEIIRQSKF